MAAFSTGEDAGVDAATTRESTIAALVDFAAETTTPSRSRTGRGFPRALEDFIGTWSAVAVRAEVLVGRPVTCSASSPSEAYRCW